MKHIILTIALFFYLFSTAQVYNPLSYSGSATPIHGLKIKTNIPFTHGIGMPTIHIEGYAYGKAKSLNVTLNWYPYNDAFFHAIGSSSGGFTPSIKLANDGGKVSIYVDEKIYYQRFNVRAYAKGKGETAAMFEGWTIIDEPISGTNIKEVSFSSSFTKDVVVNSNGNVGIGITNPTSPLHVSNTNDAIATFQTLDDKWLYTNWKNKSGQRKAYMGFSADLSNFVLGLENGANRFTIPSGNVGIGTYDPSQKLEVFNSNAFNSNMEAQGQDHITLSSNDPGNGNYFGGITWKSTTGTLGRRRAAITAVQEHTDTDFIGLAFFTKGTDGPGPMYESMRLSRSGNLGIGTTTPSAGLEVKNNEGIKVQSYTNASSKGNIKMADGFQNATSRDDMLFNTGGGFMFKMDDNANGISHGGSGVVGFNIYNRSNESIFAVNESTGNVGVGTTDPKNKLSVDGTIWATKVKVMLTDAADWVFEDDYKLRPLNEVAKFIKQNKHLPEIPSADEFRANDLEVSEMTNKLLQKIEELTLYTIAQENEIQELQSIKIKNKELEMRLAKIEALLVK